MTKETDRKTYLREWRAGLWEQIRQKENAIWQFISFYAAGAVLLFGLINISDQTRVVEVSNSTAILIGLINLFITGWGVMIVLDANFWLQRNLIFVGNIEKELLEKGDFGKLIPAYYSELPNYRYEKSYSIHIFILLISNLFAQLLISSVTSTAAALTQSDIGLIAIYCIAFSFGMLAIYFKDRNLVDEFYRVRQEAPGKNLSAPKKFDKKRAVFATFVASPVTVWVGFLSGIGCSIFLLLGINYQGWIVNQVALGFLTLFVPIAAAGLLILAGSSRVANQFEQKILSVLYERALNLYTLLILVGLLTNGVIWICIGVGVVY